MAVKDAAAVCSYSGTDLLQIAGLAVLYPATRWLLNRWLFNGLSRLLLLPNSIRWQTILPEQQALRVTKLSESLWKLLTYASFIALGLYCIAGQHWPLQPQQYWDGWPHHSFGPAMLWLFRLQLAYYISTIITLALWEVPRKDFHVMMTHHCATVILLSTTYSCRYMRSGCITLLLHDTTDVLMEVAKVCNYLQLDAIANVLFAVFMASWAGLRLYLFPRYIVLPIFSWPTRLGYDPPFLRWYQVLFPTLYCMHVWWFGLILRIAVLTLTTGRAEDIREDD